MRQSRRHNGQHAGEAARLREVPPDQIVGQRSGLPQFRATHPSTRHLKLIPIHQKINDQSCMGERLCELEEKLRKSEQQRQKLRDNLVSRCHLYRNILLVTQPNCVTGCVLLGMIGVMSPAQKFFKEKATNTQELLRQHVQLQTEAERKDCELLQLKLARQELQMQLEAMQTTSEATASAEPERCANPMHRD